VDRETPGNRIQVSGARYLKPVSRKMSGGKHSLWKDLGQTWRWGALNVPQNIWGKAKAINHPKFWHMIGYTWIYLDHLSVPFKIVFYRIMLYRLFIILLVYLEGLDLPGRMVNPVLARLRLSGGCGVYHWPGLAVLCPLEMYSYDGTTHDVRSC
jgi:hypothetical protein